MMMNLKSYAEQYKFIFVALLYIGFTYGAWDSKYGGESASVGKVILVVSAICFSSAVIKFFLRNDPRIDRIASAIRAVGLGILIYIFVFEPSFQFLYFGYLSQRWHDIRAMWMIWSGGLGLWSLTLRQTKLGILIVAVSFVLFLINFNFRFYN